MKSEIREAIKIGRLVRNSIYKMLVGNGSGYCNPNMGGECGRAAYLLSRALPSGAKVVTGSWTRSGSHCWVIYKGYIIDPTATQFDGIKPSQRVYVLKADGKRAKELYEPGKHGRAAERFLANWYGGDWKRSTVRYYRKFLKEREAKETGA